MRFIIVALSLGLILAACGHENSSQKGQKNPTYAKQEIEKIIETQDGIEGASGEDDHALAQNSNATIEAEASALDTENDPAPEVVDKAEHDDTVEVDMD